MNFPSSSPLGPIRQIGYVVPNIAEAAQYWIERHGAGPFFEVGEISFDGWSYKGAPQQLPLFIAFGQLGDVMIELIRPGSAVESVYSHAIGPAPVLHHLGFLVPDLDAAASAAGLGEIVTEARSVTGTGLRYYDSRTQNGVMIELLTDLADMRETFELSRTSAQDWDGSSPLRPFPLPK